jgi:hypothetical protein
MNIALTNTLLTFAKNYLEGIRHVLYWLKERKIDPNKSNILSIVHEELYEKLKGLNLPSKVSENCYRNAISIYKV